MLLARSHAHTIHSTSQHLDWDSSRLPVLRAAPGDEVEFREIDAMCGQITAQTREEELPGLDPARINPVSGPVYVEGAEPGDSVTVTLLGFESQGWGWTAVFPDFGLLQRDFSTPAIHHWTYDRTFGQAAAYGRWAKVPLRPFCGTVGVAQAAPGSFSTLPPYRTGGNMDIRDLTEGVVLHLPVEVPGALVSIGDPHAAQGDGEVCGTALESPMSVRARLGLGSVDASYRFARLRRDHRHWPGSYGGGLRRREGHDRPACRARANECRGCIHALQRVRRSAYQ
jgi:acetamidase/formamidase